MPAKEADWEWVRVLMARYKAREEAALKGVTASMRFAQEKALATSAQLKDSAKAAEAAAEAAVETANARVSKQVRKGLKEYPEVFVGGGAVTYSCSLGAANGTMLAGPRRTVIVAAVIAAVLRTPLSAKWGDSLVAASGSLSSLLRSRVEAAGWLPAPAEE